MDVVLSTLTGSPAVSIDGQPHHLAPLNLALLVRLRYAEFPVPRSELVKLFWPNTPGRPNLSTALRALRSVLGEGYIPLSEDPVALGQELPADTDLVEAAAKNPTSDAVRAALAAYTAPFLVGIDTRLPTTVLTRWVAERREHYRTLLLESVEAACRGAVAANAWEDVEPLVVGAEERGFTSETLRAWRLEAVRRRTMAAAPPGRRRFTRFAGILAALVLAASVFAFLHHTKEADGAGDRMATREVCGNGEAVAHLVRKELKPETNLPVAAGGTVSPRWVLRNDGRCTWDSMFVVRRVYTFGLRSARMESDILRTGRAVPPGDTVVIVHRVTAPSIPGDFGENWVLEDGARHAIPVDGRPFLPERFQVLPRPLLPCTDADVRAGYLAASYPDSAIMASNEDFVATWTVINRGKCIWQAGQVAILFSGELGQRMSDPRVMEIPTEEPVQPSDAYTFEVHMHAPASGWAIERWTLRPANTQFGEMPTLRALVRAVRISRQSDGEVPECKPGEEIVGWLRSERIQDSTVVTAGDTVRKTWTLRNEGECTWAPRSLTLRFRSATQPRENTVTDRELTQAVPPNATYTFSVPLVAPPGQPVYDERWELVNREGGRIRFGQVLYLSAVIKVRPASK